MRIVEQLKHTQQLEQQVKARTFQRPSSTAVSEVGASSKNAASSPVLKGPNPPLNNSSMHKSFQQKPPA